MVRAFNLALGFLTRIPVQVREPTDAEWKRSVAFYPWMGLLIGALLYGASLLQLFLNPALTALVVVVCWAWITGGLHLDGVADTVDGLSGGRGDAERTLEIMRDSRIGSHGAVALILLIAVKWQGVVYALEHDEWAWVCAPMWARFAAVHVIAGFAYARDQGLGRAVAGPLAWPSWCVALVLPLTYAAWAIGNSANEVSAPLLAPVLALLVARLAALRVRRVVGGVTGDTYGAVIELSEVVFLIVLAAGSRGA